MDSSGGVDSCSVQDIAIDAMAEGSLDANRIADPF